MQQRPQHGPYHVIFLLVAAIYFFSEASALAGSEPLRAFKGTARIADDGGAVAKNRVWRGAHSALIQLADRTICESTASERLKLISSRIGN